MPPTSFAVPESLPSRRAACAAFASLCALCSLAVFAPRLAHFARRDALPPVSVLQYPFASSVIVSERFRLIFCPIPKAASSNWKFLIRKFDGVSRYDHLQSAHNPNSSGLRYLSDYSPADADRLLNDPTYFKFTFVRDPYARLLSCYMDKFRSLQPRYLASEYRTFLAAAFGWPYARIHANAGIFQPHSTSAPDQIVRPSFRTFVHAIVSQSPDQMNAHWRPQSLLCGFDFIRYDFIGRMESLHRDANYVLSRIGRSNESFPTQSDLGFPSSGASPALAHQLYSTDLMLLVRIIYAADFHALGYNQ